MQVINQLAKEHKLLIVEDAAQAHGAYYDNKRTSMEVPTIFIFLRVDEFVSV
jgi:dTDP-4-amino-4,6-dideoxygalactose transaminase